NFLFPRFGFLFLLVAIFRNLGTRNFPSAFIASCPYFWFLVPLFPYMGGNNQNQKAGKRKVHPFCRPRRARISRRLGLCRGREQGPRFGALRHLEYRPGSSTVDSRP